MARDGPKGEYDQYEVKHDCPRPMVGCSWPRCSCDVDDVDMTLEEKKESELTETLNTETEK